MFSSLEPCRTQHYTTNTQRNSMVLWDKVTMAVDMDFLDATINKMLVNTMTTHMILKPESLDTIVAINLVSITHNILNMPEITHM